MEISDNMHISELQNKKKFFSNFSLLSFYIGTMLLLFLKFMGLNFGDTIYKIGTVIGFAFLLFKVINTKYEKKELFKIAIIFIISILLFFISKRPALPMTLIILISSKGIDKKFFIKSSFFISLSAFFLVLFLCLIGFFENVTVTMDRLTQNGIVEITRYSLGYFHPNITYMNFFIIITLYFLYKNNEVNYFTYGIIFITAIVLYKITLCRTGFLCVLIILIFSLILKYELPNKINILNMLKYTPFLLGIGILSLSFIYTGNSKLLSLFNKLFSGRLYYNNLFLSQIPISLLGANMGFLENAEAFLDCGYVLLFLSHGLIIFTSFIYFTYKRLDELNYKKDILFYIIITILIYCITEYFLTNILINYTLIYYNKFIFKEND